jgi:hypothetical protein
MTRYEFLKSAGFTGASLMALLSCVKTDDSYVEALVQNPDGTTSTGNSGATGTTGTAGTGAVTTADKSFFVSNEALNKLTAKVKIDLSSATYSRLKTVGGYVIVSNTYVVALSKTGKFIAAKVTCSHEPKKRIVYSNEEWYCTEHGAKFSLAGKGLNSNGRKGLIIYNTATDGNTLIIY